MLRPLGRSASPKSAAGEVWQSRDLLSHCRVARFSMTRHCLQDQAFSERVFREERRQRLLPRLLAFEPLLVLRLAFAVQLP